MAHMRDPRTSIQSRLAAEHHPVPSHMEDDPSSIRNAGASDERDPRPPGVSGAETIAFVVALVIVVVLVALL
jgi:hypothetical protein